MPKGVYDRRINVMNKSDISMRYRIKHLNEIRRKAREYYYKNKGEVNQRIAKKRINNSKSREKYSVQQKTYSKYDYKPCCEMCGSKVGIQHHHYTEPPNENCFIDVCNNCHSICERYDRLTNNKRKLLILDDVKKILYSFWVKSQYISVTDSHRLGCSEDEWNELLKEIAKHKERK